MKIEINQIPLEGLLLEEDIVPSELDVEGSLAKLADPIHIKANISKITNAVTVAVELTAPIKMACSRCLDEFKVDFKKALTLNYPVDKLQKELDINQDIRDEIILDYPIKPLCRPDCKGLCPKCGKNLNEGLCKCPCIGN